VHRNIKFKAVCRLKLRQNIPENYRFGATGVVKISLTFAALGK
jgi:hypothetical protein